MRRLMRLAIFIAVIFGVLAVAARLFDSPYDGPILAIAAVALLVAVFTAVGSVVRGDGPWRNGYPARPQPPEHLRPASGTTND